MARNSESRLSSKPWFWTMVSVLLFFCTFGAAALCVAPPRALPAQVEHPALFGGTAQIGLLALLLALSAYLRQVYSAAMETRDKIKGGEIWNFPPGLKYADDRVALLEHSCAIISGISPLILVLALLAAARMCAEAYTVAYGIDSNTWLFTFGDFIFALWVLLLLIGLAIAHFYGRWKDSRIRIKARIYERAHPQVLVKSKAATVPPIDMKG